MSLTIGLTATFGAIAGFTVSGALKFLDGFSVMGPASNKFPSWPTSLLIGSLIGGGLGAGSAWYADEGSAEIENISRQQATEIVLCHDKKPEGFDVQSGLNLDGTVICNYLKPN